MRPERPMISAFAFFASDNILSAGTITPRSIILYPLQPNTTPTIFFPISCTSPFTVAKTMVPLEISASPFSSFSFSINGIKWATAFFITRADFTTCGRNILPEPNKSPTRFIPSINGPSITSIGRSNWILASSVSSTINLSIPSTKA